MSLCNHCDEQELYIFPCLESLEEVKEVERMPSKEYIPKGVPILSYQESRITKDNKPLNFE